MIILVLITVVIWCLLGITPGILWSRKGDKAFPWNEHLVFISTALFILLLPPIAILVDNYDHFYYCIVSILFYPFFYNGCYYVTRKQIDGSYPDGWRSEPSKTSTAKINLSWNFRWISFFIGVLLLILYEV